MAPSFGDASEAFRLAVAVAGFAEALRGSFYAVYWSMEDIERMVTELQGDRPERVELARLIAMARNLRDSG